jgi:hypothetical protein
MTPDPSTRTWSMCLNIRDGEAATVEEHLADVSSFDAYFA